MGLRQDDRDCYLEFLSTLVGPLLRVAGRHLEGELDEETVQIFEQHRSICPDCVAYLDSYRKRIRLAKDALESTDKVFNEGVPQPLVEAILAARQK